MLTGNRAKYLGLIFAISFSSFLITQQSGREGTTGQSTVTLRKQEMQSLY
jgi:hypothetical protein